MALPKEPRQKMINMMYLVLTALLALNVSAEILNAFKTVNNGITNANGVLTQNNAAIYNALQQNLSDPKTHEKAQRWEPLAIKAQALCSKVYTDIDSLKERIKIAGGFKPGAKDSIGFESNLDASTRIMDQEGEGEKLQKKLADLKQNLLAIDPAIGKEFASKLPIDATTPPAAESGNTKRTWTTAYFHMTPAIAALTILNKFQNDIKTSENQIVTFCNSQISAVAVRFDKFGFVGGLSSSYLMPGEKLTVSAGLGATATAAAPTILINGKPVPLNPDGMAVTDFPVSGSGSVNILIKYTDQDGVERTIPKKIDYTVGQPSGVAVSADKMNVLYIGVDNPLTITAGVGAEKVNATLSGGTIERAGGPKWIAKPKTPGDQTISVIVDGKATPVRYRVKYLPDPASFVANKRGGPIPSADLKAQGGVIARLLESDFEASFKVVSYSVGAVGGKFPVYQTASNDGNQWKGNAATIINSATPGTSIFFDNIKVQGPDGKVRDLPQMSFNLR